MPLHIQSIADLAPPIHELLGVLQPGRGTIQGSQSQQSFFTCIKWSVKFYSFKKKMQGTPKHFLSLNGQG